MDKNFLEDILKKLKKKGAEEADVVLFSSKNKSSSCRLGEIEKTEESVTNEIGIRVIIKKRQSIISSTNIETSNVNSLIEKVIEMAKVVPKDEFCGLASNNQISIPNKEDLKSLELFDTYEPDKKEINDKVLLLEQRDDFYIDFYGSPEVPQAFEPDRPTDSQSIKTHRFLIKAHLF